MSDDGDLFNEGVEEQPGEEELFGEEDGNFQDEQEAVQEEEQPVQEEPAAPAVNETSERRKRLAELVKKRTGGGDRDGPPKKKKQKGDKQGERSSGRSQRLRRRAGSPATDEGRGQQQFGAEVPEEELAKETAEDDGFIDDDEVPEDERYVEDVEALAAAEEAEEAQPGDADLVEPTNIIDEVLQRRKRAKRKETDADIDNEVMSLVSMMTACAEKDVAAMEQRPPQPAIDKLKALAEVGKTLRQRKHHETFLASKGLNAMAAWLRPYSNGTLPNAKVRGELVSLLAVLQLDTTNDYVRERLEESELGKIIMFYYKNPNESMNLRSQCRDLIQAWSAPIFADNDEELRKRRQRERAHRQRQAAERAERERREKQETEEAERRRKLNPKEQGFRARAAVPQPSKMDFVINPGSKMDPLDALRANAAAAGAGGGSGGPKAKQMPIGGRLGKVLQQRKRVHGTAWAA